MDKTLIPQPVETWAPGRAPLPIETELGLWVDRSGAGTRGHDAFRKLGLLGVVWIYSGSGTYQVQGGDACPISRGDVLLLFPDVPCRYLPDAGGWKSRWLVIQDGGFSERHSLLRRDRPCFPFPDRRGEWHFRKLSAGGPRNNPMAAVERHGHLWELLRLLSEAQSRGELRDPLEDLLSRVAAHPGENWTIRDLAKSSGLSPAQFRRRLRKITGHSPKGYLTSLRMDEACRLALTQHTVAAIAERVGYQDPFFFMRAFRQHLGMTVGEYRAKHRL